MEFRNRQQYAADILQPLRVALANQVIAVQRLLADMQTSIFLPLMDELVDQIRPARPQGAIKVVVT